MILGIASILFACTAANHLGLIAAIERTIRHRLPIANCSKCLTFWVTLTYCLYKEVGTAMFAIAFLNSYISIWLELGMGYVDYIYNKVYDTLYNSTDNEAPSESDEGNSTDGVSDLQ